MSYDIIIGRDDADKKRFGNKGLINFGKGYVKMGQYSSLSNPILMDISRSHVILVAGKRGSGKSYSLGVIAEEISQLPEEARQNIAPLIFDTMGIFWTMKYENEKEKKLLGEWGLKPKKLPVKVRAQRAGCLDICNYGQTIAVYPEGVFYVGVELTDVDEIIEEHIINNRPVQRLILTQDKY